MDCGALRVGGDSGAGRIAGQADQGGGGTGAGRGTDASPGLRALGRAGGSGGQMPQWDQGQNRRRDRLYAIVFLDALRVKIRRDGVVKNQAVYLALGVAADGTRDVLGLWIEQAEGAKFWLKVMNELRNRGVGDILIAVVDG